MKRVFLILSTLSINLFGQTISPDTSNYSLQIKEQTIHIEENSTNWEAYYKRGNYKLALNQYKEAIKDYDKAIEIHIKNAEIANAYSNRGIAKYKLGYYGEALLDCKTADVLSPKTPTYKSNYVNIKDAIRNAHLNDNYYASWHQKTRDTSSLQTVSKGAFYLFGGFGVGGEPNIKKPNRKSSSTNTNSGFGSIIGCSVAYKSHLITFDRVGVRTVYTPLTGEKYEGDKIYKSNYTGALFGECVRTKHFLISLSAGVASTTIYKAHLSSSYNEEIDLNKQFVSIPVEFKFNWLSHNGVGAGFQISYNIVPSTPYSGLYLHTNIVLGVWNKMQQ